MSVQTQTQSESKTESKARPKLKTSLVVDEELWKHVRKIAIDIDEDASILTELSLEVLLAILKIKSIPRELEEALSRETVEHLRKIIARDSA